MVSFPKDVDGPRLWLAAEDKAELEEAAGPSDARPRREARAFRRHHVHHLWPALLRHLPQGLHVHRQGAGRRRGRRDGLLVGALGRGSRRQAGRSDRPSDRRRRRRRRRPVPRTHRPAPLLPALRRGSPAAGNAFASIAGKADGTVELFAIRQNRQKPPAGSRAASRASPPAGRSAATTGSPPAPCGPSTWRTCTS